MAETTRVKPTMDWDVYVENRAKWSYEAMRPYAGHWVAWSLDATRIVDSDPDLVKLDNRIESMGIATDEVLHEWFPDDESLMVS